MDPISLIIAALVAGAAAGTKDTASSAVKDAYEGLKGLIRRRFSGDPAADGELQEAEEAPAGDHSSLSARLKAIGAGDDEEILRAAQKVLAQAGKYNISIKDSKGIAAGDYQTTTMIFND